MEQKKITQGDLVSMFLRSNLQQASFNFERIHGLGFCYDMIPAIKRLYPLKADQVAALKRHLVFFNTTPAVCGPVIGVTAAMEEARANGAEIDDGAINGIKVGLMGPLAGVGDPIFWGTVRPVFAALGAGIAMSGSLLGPLLFFILFNAVRLLTRYYGVAYGYRKGVDIVKDMGGGFLQKLTEGASILGLFVMGALVNKWTHVNIPMVVSKITGSDGQVHVTTVQTILDQLMPGLVPLLLTFACMWLLRKKVNPLWIIVGFFVIGIAGYAVGLLGL
ncbi:PTS system, mannose-specific IID component [Klebsiella pneumoniae subsp. pneumoniae ST512-K30BO]|uniref:PTS mannose transporter subunit IID n=1 Tax=Klebsiella pneumoniae TaxID=573 RepID=UPI00026871F3|nr:PTS mannose transporter subunit IID [Klebsiella pneumoniae]CCM85797.1 PTS system, mannose-specific IID component [Klebsiella pneumoniae subsp. pneumoniae ST258-K26BO]CCM92330.1 PTS system, mannose-specific IID component [Klebsiella pneumoniae subsp. pneumoniae ST512-K30BO]